MGYEIFKFAWAFVCTLPYIFIIRGLNDGTAIGLILFAIGCFNANLVEYSGVQGTCEWLEGFQKPAEPNQVIISMIENRYLSRLYFARHILERYPKAFKALQVLSRAGNVNDQAILQNPQVLAELKALIVALNVHKNEHSHSLHEYIQDFWNNTFIKVIASVLAAITTFIALLVFPINAYVTANFPIYLVLLPTVTAVVIAVRIAYKLANGPRNGFNPVEWYPQDHENRSWLTFMAQGFNWLYGVNFAFMAICSISGLSSLTAFLDTNVYRVKNGEQNIDNPGFITFLNAGEQASFYSNSFINTVLAYLIVALLLINFFLYRNNPVYVQQQVAKGALETLNKILSLGNAAVLSAPTQATITELVDEISPKAIEAAEAGSINGEDTNESTGLTTGTSTTTSWDRVSGCFGSLQETTLSTAAAMGRCLFRPGNAAQPTQPAYTPLP